eukprot:CAMPEP_0195058304 /NCGR_PEP_ID=MMETSP0448-20130528/6220_1 /TAXON_ID=66468 /ORGANISM="Heterocapsa triquestra, Strain CCMP 448" /LENGTH=123 /DNA_ID=CAMNT_0040088443 /DNA_START=254 /DNA_END=622 /DNA_ORIENTATION=-
MLYDKGDLVDVRLRDAGADDAYDRLHVRVATLLGLITNAHAPDPAANDALLHEAADGPRLPGEAEQRRGADATVHLHPHVEVAAERREVRHPAPAEPGIGAERHGRSRARWPTPPPAAPTGVR